MMKRFQTLLSISTCAATSGGGGQQCWRITPNTRVTLCAAAAAAAQSDPGVSSGGQSADTMIAGADDVLAAGFTLVHFPAQPEPFRHPKHPLNFPNTP